jgi:subtilisin family serine protease
VKFALSFRVTFLTLVIGHCLVIGSWSLDISRTALYAPDHLLISLKPAAQKKLSLLNLPRGTKLSASVPNQFHYLTLPPNLPVPEALRLLAKNPLVEYAEPDWITTGAGRLSAEPADAWHLATIQVTNAWEITQGSSSIIAAILDSGLADLPQFSLRVVPGYNFAYTNSNTLDDNGHGTQVTSAFASVDRHCRIMPIKVFNEANLGFHSWWAQGIDYAVSNGCKVINLSGVSTEFGRTVQRAITNAIAHGVIFVTAAGNLGATNLSFPGYLTHCITVGATDQEDRRARFSNSGSQLDLVAPGVALPTVGLSGDIEHVEGTSLSAPLVSAVCTLLASLRPNLTQAEARQLLCAAAEDQVGDASDISGFDNYYGWGRLNAFYSLILGSTHFDSIQLRSGPVELSWGSPSNAESKRPYQVQYTTSLAALWQTAKDGMFRYERGRTIWTYPKSETNAAGYGKFFRLQIVGY